MKYLLLLLCLIFSAFEVFGQESRNISIPPPFPITIDDRAIAFEHVNVVPMDNDQILTDQTVLVEGDRISKIGPAGEVSLPAGTTIINGEGKYLIPGLSEMHGHVPPLDSDPLRYMEDVLFLYLAGGITTVRGMLGHPGQLELKEKVKSNEIIGPSLYLAGPSFNGNSINSPEEANERVIRQKEEGWDLLKIHPGLTLEEFRMMAETAHEQNIAFAGHVPADVGLVNAIRLGQETIDHLDGYIEYMDGFDQPVLDTQLEEVVRMTTENDVWVIPTQALWETLIGAADHDRLMDFEELKYMPPEIVNDWKEFLENQANSQNYNPESASIHAENRQKLLKALQDGGAKILLGTDSPQIFSVPGFSMKHELKRMAEAGLTPFEILSSGTSNVGEYFSDKDNFGVIREDYRADLILVSENPLEDLHTIIEHEGVMVRGMWLSRQDIDKKLEEIESAYQP